MTKTAQRSPKPVNRIGVPMTPQKRAAILRNVFGAWKHRSLKKDLQELAKIRRGLDRKIR